MGKSLQRDSYLHYIFFCFTLVLLFSITEESISQVSLQNLQPSVIDFGSEIVLSNSPVETSLQASYNSGPVTLRYQTDLSDATDLAQQNPDSPFFKVEIEETEVLGYRPTDSRSQELFQIQYLNSTGRTIEELRLRFSLAYRADPDNPYQLSLSHNLDGNPVNEIESPLIDVNTSADGSEDWQLTDVGLTVDRLYLADGESVTMSLSWENLENMGESAAVAMRRLVLTPVPVPIRPGLVAGDLVISEIMAQNPNDPNQAQYIEVYNRSENSINLSGMGIRVNESTYRVRDYLSLPPYSMRIIANRDEVAPGINADNTIENLSIASTGGEIELIFDGVPVFLSQYSEQSTQASRELQNVNRVRNGQANAAEFRDSEIRIGLNAYGSPGQAGSTQRLFSFKPLETENWNLMSIPGSFLSSENHNLRLPESQTEAGRGQGFFIKTDDPGSDSEILVEEEISGDAYQISLSGSNHGWHIIGSPFIEGFNFSQLSAVNGSLYGHSAQVWDAERQTFRLLSRSGNRIEPWQALLIRNSDATALRVTSSSGQGSGQIGTDISSERLIGFELSGTNSQDERFFDEAAVLYFRNEPENNSDDLSSNDYFNSEKLWPLFSSDTGIPKASIIYFLRQTAQRTLYLSQETRNFNPGSAFEVRMGHLSLNTAGSFTLRWPEMINIPDNWSLFLLDHDTGERVDMRLVNSYEFESAAWLPPDPDYIGEEPNIHPVSGVPENSRFSIQVNPQPDLVTAQAETGEESDRVEFLPNYPNPFSVSTTFRFYLPRESEVSIEIYTIAGQQIERVVNTSFPAGEHEVDWDASHLPNQFYYVRLRVGSVVRTRAVIKQ